MRESEASKSGLDALREYLNDQAESFDASAVMKLNSVLITKPRQLVHSLRELVEREWEGFKSEQKVKWYDKPVEEASLDFDAIKKDWEHTPENSGHWKNQLDKEEGRCCPPFFFTFLLNFCFTFIPNASIGLDVKAYYEYYFGTWYVRRYGKEEPYPLECRNTNSTHGEDVVECFDAKINGTWNWEDLECKNSKNWYGRVVYECLVANKTVVDRLECRNTTAWFQGEVFECFQEDRVYGALTLVILFMPGVFWSLNFGYKFVGYLKRKHPETFRGAMMNTLFFLPMGLLVMVTYPFQLLVVSILFCFNDQDSWALLTAKAELAEGFYNSHFQYLLGLYIIFNNVERLPSVVQLMIAFGSLSLLAISRVQSLLLDRGGYRLGVGQQIWWILRFGPVHLFNGAFKLGCISLFATIFKWEFLCWFYGGWIFFYIILHFLFNESLLPRRFYFLFIGAAAHTITVPEIVEEVKLLKTFPPSKKTLWATILTPSEIKINLWFHNIVWFLVNSTIMITVTLKPMDDMKLNAALPMITPVLISIGVISLLLLFAYEIRSIDQDTFIRSTSTYPHFTHLMGGDCPGCNYAEGWHHYTVTDPNQVNKQTLKFLLFFVEL